MTSIIRMQDAGSFSLFRFISKFGGERKNHNDMIIDSGQNEEELDRVRQSAISEGHSLGYKKGFDEGEKEGYGTGLLKGAKEGSEEVKADLNIALSSLNLALIDVQDIAFNMQDSVKKTSLTVIEEITKKVINKELSLHPEIIVNWVDDSLATLPEMPSVVTVTLNNEDYDRIIELAEFKDNYDWKLKSNSLIKLGCCEVTTNLADIKINPQEKIHKILEQVE